MAMLMVFGYHIWEFAGHPRFTVHLGSWSVEILESVWGARGAGFVGVGVFITLSGFCLFFPLCSHPYRLQRFDLKTYATRRVRR